MFLEKLLEKRELCINDNPPACEAACPLHVDVKGIMREVQGDNFQGAFEILEKRMPLARLVARVCDHPCESSCVRKDLGGSLSIGGIERALVEYGSKTRKKSLRIPGARKKVAVVGGGISGLSCAVLLNKKAYDITIFEKSDRLGGSFWDYLDKGLSQASLEDELEEVKKSGISVRLNSPIDRAGLKELKGAYEAVYLGTGTWEEELDFDEKTLATSLEGIFIGGSLTLEEDSLIMAVARGRSASISMDRYMQGASLSAQRSNEGPYETELIADTSAARGEETVQAAGDVYTKEEAAKEAARCLLCECGLCYKACSHLRYEDKMPRDYIRSIHHNERVILGDRYANKAINSCMACGLCLAVCPTDLDMGEIILDTRKSMVEREKMPPSAHDFALKDMEFNQSEYFSLLKHQPGMEESAYVFFPGCQLSSSYPQYVDKSYDYLKEKLEGGVGLYLNCCGAPAEWAGREELFKASIEKLKVDLESLGNPKLVLACSTCYYIFEKYLPDVELVSLWEIFDKKGLPEVETRKDPGELVIHDSCTARDFAGIYDSVRGIAETLGYKLTEPRYSKKETKCCGYGGLSYFANRDYSQFATEERIGEYEGDYLAYCAMCRDLFVSGGKRTYHILDLIFGKGQEELASKKGPSLSERRDNRLRFKIFMLDKHWGEDLNLSEEYGDIELIVDDRIKELMEDRLILAADIKKVIGQGQDKKDFFYNPDSQQYLAFRRIVNVTYWVEYVKEETGYRIINIYSHRMDVKGD
ncbi:MAG: NAD(P)-binding protein [Tissierellia bacterium]|nr:NAD(P)-binding protein [Tissierellia bacterium]